MTALERLLRAPLEALECEQGSPEWFQCRIGIPTASEFATLLMKAKDGKGPSLTRLKYVRQTAGEIITGQADDAFTNRHMERGKEMEAEARSKYAFLKGVDPVQVGFLRRGRCGASPDSVIGDDGLLEIKTKLPHLQIEVLERKVCPPEHYDQIQGQLMVSGRAWCDFVSYWPRMPMFCIRVERDEAHMETLAAAVAKFNDDVDALLAKLGCAPQIAEAA